MRKISYPRMEVLQSLYNLTADISQNRFISSRPNAVGEEMEDFLLIRLPQAMLDEGDTWQSTTGQIICFVRDIQGVIENTFQLEQMQSAIMELFPIVEKRYSAIDPIILPGGTDGAGFHSLIIQFSITLNKKPIN